MERLLRKIKSSDIAKRIATGAFWSLTGTAIGKFCVLISGIVCARILGKMTFGEFGMIRSTLGMYRYILCHQEVAIPCEEHRNYEVVPHESASVPGQIARRLARL